MTTFLYNSFWKAFPVVKALAAHGVGERDCRSALFWWMHVEPGQTMMLVRYGAPALRIDCDGNVTEVASIAAPTIESCTRS